MTQELMLKIKQDYLNAILFSGDPHKSFGEMVVCERFLNWEPYGIEDNPGGE